VCTETWSVTNILQTSTFKYNLFNNFLCALKHGVSLIFSQEFVSTVRRICSQKNLAEISPKILIKKLQNLSANVCCVWQHDFCTEFVRTKKIMQNLPKYWPKNCRIWVQTCVVCDNTTSAQNLCAPNFSRKFPPNIDPKIAEFECNDIGNIRVWNVCCVAHTTCAHDSQISTHSNLCVQSWVKLNLQK